MNKHLIFIIAINDPNRQIQNQEYAQYSIKTWEYWCKKNNVDLKVLTEDELGLKFPIWNKHLVYEYGKGYDKIGVVDSDTMIRWDAPNIFDFTDPAKFYGVNDLCDINWLLSSIEQRQKFFPNVKMNLNKYLNAGVLFFGAEHLIILEKFLTFVKINEVEINQLDGGGKEQTLLNFWLQNYEIDNRGKVCQCKNGIFKETTQLDDLNGTLHCSVCNDEIERYSKVEIELLDPEWNLLSIHRKNMFTGNWQLKVDPLPYFLKYAFVWHFTGFPIEDRVRLMKETWEIIKENYV